jgi:hypothetical protein
MAMRLSEYIAHHFLVGRLLSVKLYKAYRCDGFEIWSAAASIFSSCHSAICDIVLTIKLVRYM